MPNFSTDAHLVKWEPDVFRLCRFPHQKLATGAAGATAAGSATLTDATGDFVNAGVTAGHVIYLSKAGSWDDYLPVASRESATSLTLDAPRGIFTTQSSIAWSVHTFDPQHEEARFELMERFSLDDTNPLAAGEADVFNARVLRRASVFRVLETIFRAQSAGESDLLWHKADRYRTLYDRAIESITVRLDLDGDGTPDRAKDGGSIDLLVEDAGDAWPV
jgi:hypothetical protein